MCICGQFQQSVSLAQRLVGFQREALELQQKLKAATFERQQLEHDVQHFKTQLAHLHQPQSYLVRRPHTVYWSWVECVRLTWSFHRLRS